MSGQVHRPSLGDQMDGIIDELNSILDGELIDSLDEVLQAAIYQEDADGMDTARCTRYLRTQTLLNKLRTLQKTRLRDAIGRIVKTEHVFG